MTWTTHISSAPQRLSGDVRDTRVDWNECSLLVFANCGAAAPSKCVESRLPILRPPRPSLNFSLYTAMVTLHSYRLPEFNRSVRVVKKLTRNPGS